MAHEDPHDFLSAEHHQELQFFARLLSLVILVACFLFVFLTSSAVTNCRNASLATSRSEGYPYPMSIEAHEEPRTISSRRYYPPPKSR